MGIKRFLVAGGMASLVFIGVVLMVDAKVLAKNSTSPTKVAGQCQNDPMQCPQAVGTAIGVQPGNVSKVAGQCQNDPMQCPQAVGTAIGVQPGNQPSPQEGSENQPSPKEVPGNQPSPQEVASMGMGGTRANGDGSAGATGGAGATGATGGAGGAGGATVIITDLPDTGGPSLDLLLATALLLGFGLSTAAFVRSLRA